jgi:ring-1,2-phenylacetyl-CoA epoxidase subunit PaaE
MISLTLKIVDIINETKDTKTICFKQPGLKRVKYFSGQYLTLVLRINGRRFIRPYSFSSSPFVDQYLNITVKRIPNGVVSNYIYDTLKIDDLVEVLPPLGDFIIPEHLDYKTIFLWGAGSGITPLISIAKSSLFKTPEVNIKLIYGNKNKDSVIFDQLIKNLEIDYPKSFNCHHFYSQISADSSLINLTEGRINAEKVIALNKSNCLENSIHFICGPEGLKNSVKQVLKGVGVEEAHIFSEDFELIKDPKDFEDIETRSINLSFKGENSILEVPKGKSILEVALDAGLELPYSCQTGSCNTCKAKLASGAVKMIGLNKKREDLLADEFLLCCSHPLNNQVYLEI